MSEKKVHISTFLVSLWTTGLLEYLPSFFKSLNTLMHYLHWYICEQWWDQLFVFVLCTDILGMRLRPQRMECAQPKTIRSAFNDSDIMFCPRYLVQVYQEDTYVWTVIIWMWKIVWLAGCSFWCVAVHGHEETLEGKRIASKVTFGAHFSHFVLLKPEWANFVSLLWIQLFLLSLTVCHIRSVDWVAWLHLAEYLLLFFIFSWTFHNFVWHANNSQNNQEMIYFKLA